MYGRIVVKKSKSKKGGWYFVVLASNGKTLAHSENYTRLKSAKRGAKLTSWISEYEVEK